MNARLPTPTPSKKPLLPKILLFVLAPVLIFATVAAMQPDDFRITRGATIAGPPALVFEQVNDLQKWQAWSPWAKLDPHAKTTFTEKIAGKNAAFTWAGNNEVGEGMMTILESQSNELVQFKLEFKKPFVGTSTTEFTFKPEGDKTHVTWGMFGKNGFMGKAMSLLMNCDKMVGGQFEQGLQNLNDVVQKEQK